MARPKQNDNLTPFGEFLRDRGISYEAAADALGIGRSFVSMLARGAAKAGMQLAWKIHVWTGQAVPLWTWIGIESQNISIDRGGGKIEIIPVPVLPPKQKGS